jgi:hypothetical protein
MKRKIIPTYDSRSEFDVAQIRCDCDLARAVCGTIVIHFQPEGGRPVWPYIMDVCSAENGTTTAHTKRIRKPFSALHCREFLGNKYFFLLIIAEICRKME